MKTKLAIAALGIALSAPAMASVPFLGEAHCTTLREAGEERMRARQSGLDIRASLIEEGVFLPFAVEAYSYPVFDSPNTKMQVVYDFGGKVFLACMSEGLEFNDDGIVTFSNRP